VVTEKRNNGIKKGIPATKYRKKADRRRQEGRPEEEHEIFGGGCGEVGEKEKAKH
jgi:hypothetical protein